MRMVQKKMSQKNKIKRLSDYIMTFAFGYSSLICFLEAAERWEGNKFLSTIILLCGMLSFIAIFRMQIAFLIIKFKKKKK